MSNFLNILPCVICIPEKAQWPCYLKGSAFAGNNFLTFGRSPVLPVPRLLEKKNNEKTVHIVPARCSLYQPFHLCTVPSQQSLGADQPRPVASHRPPYRWCMAEGGP